MPTSAQANPPCNASNGALYCGNDAPTNIYSAPAISSSVVDTLKSNPSYFKCYVHGEQHSGGNNVWYLTYGDETAKWGYVPAAAVWTPTGSDPFSGVDACPDQTSTDGSGQTSTDGSGQTSTDGSGQTSTDGSGQTSTDGSGQTSTDGSGQTSTDGSGQTSTDGSGQTSTDGSGQTSTGQGSTGGSSRGNTDGSGQRNPGPSGAQENPAAHRCVTATWVGYISDTSKDTEGNEKGASYYRLMWSPRACPRGNGDWAIDNAEPSVKTFGSASVLGLALELEKPQENAMGTRSTLEGRVRLCIPLKKLLGDGCVTMANIKLGWQLSETENPTIMFDSPILNRTKVPSAYGKLHWTEAQV